MEHIHEWFGWPEAVCAVCVACIWIWVLGQIFFKKMG